MARKKIGHRKKPTGARPTGVSMAARPWSVLLQFSRRSTIHGLNHMAQARSSRRRGYWLLISLGASTGFFMNLYYLIEKFVQKPVLTNVLHDYEAFEFPDITFCVLNPIYFPPENTTRRTELEYYLRAYQQYRRSPRFKRSFSRMFIADFLFVQEKDMYSHPPWSAIAKCSFMKRPCNHRHFDVVRLWPYGNCFTLNYTKLGVPGRIRFNRIPKSTLRPDFKLKVYKAVNYPENFTVDPHHSQWMASGILVMLHERGTFPDIGNSFLVDSYTQIELRITRLHHLPINNKCLPERQMYTYVDRVMKTVGTFIGTRTDCLTKKMQDKLAKYCKCLHYKHSPEIHNRHLPLCTPLNFTVRYMRKCFNKFKRDKSADKLECFKDFCEHPQFQTVISQAGYPAVRERNSFNGWMEQLRELEQREKRELGRSHIAKIFLKDWGEDHNLTMAEAAHDGRHDLLDIEKVERNFMVLRIVPSSFFEDRVEEIAEYPISRLLSDVGGCVGLWVGASLITLFEFIDLVLDCTDYRLGYGRRKRLTNFINGGGKANSKLKRETTVTANHIANNNTLTPNSFDLGNALLENSAFGTALFNEDIEPNTPDFVTTV